MKKIIVTASLIFAFIFNVSLKADDSVRGDNYWIVEIGQATFGEDATFPGDEEVDEITINMAIGYRINNYLSAEANMWWWQLNHKLDPDPLEPSGTEIDLESGVGLSLRGDIPIYKKLSGFAQVSYNMLNLFVKGQQTKEHDSGVGYSGGLEYDVPHGAVFVRYALLMDNENDDPAEIQFEDLTSMSIGYKWDLPF